MDLQSPRKANLKNNVVKFEEPISPSRRRKNDQRETNVGEEMRVVPMPKDNRTAKNKFCIDRKLLHINKTSDGFYELSFGYSALVSTMVSVYLCCKEEFDELHNITLNIKPLMKDIFTKTVSPLTIGNKKEFKTTLKINESQFEKIIEHIKEIDSQEQLGNYGMIIRLESFDSMNNKSDRLVLYNYFELDFDEEKNIIIQTARQKIERDLSAYELYDVYFNPKDKDNQDLCIICFAENSDCILGPCRHLCLCKSCADAVAKDNRGFTCPICRNPVKRVIHFTVKVPIQSYISKTELANNPVDSKNDKVREKIPSIAEE